jgi:mono/diheme cytochrome c family protein
MIHCQKCHPGGEAGLGPSVNAAPRFVKRFQMRHGLGVMPSFTEDEISKGDLQDILKYLKAWKNY